MKTFELRIQPVSDNFEILRDICPSNLMIVYTNPIIEEWKHDSENTDNHIWQAADEDKEINTECLKFGPFKTWQQI